MRAILLRRAMVLGVCALGVGALYLVPGLGTPAHRVGVPAPAADGSPRRTAPPQPPADTTAGGTDHASTAARTGSRPAAASTVTSTAPAATTDNAREPAGPGRSGAPESGDTDVHRSTVPTRWAGPGRTGRVSPAPPVDPAPGGDANPPDAVTDLAVLRADPDQVRLRWAPARDDVGVAGYRVWLNGYEVQRTDDVEVTLDWFNDDSAQHVVVVRAVDAAGNQSRTAATLLVTRPDPSAAPNPPGPSAPGAEPADPTLASTTDPSPEPTPEPTGEPTREPTSEPASEPTAEPSAEPTPRPSRRR